MNQQTRIVYTPQPEGIGAYTKKIARYRQLIVLFAGQEIKAQYAQTRFSFLWIVLRPLMVLAIFTFIFDKVMHVPGLTYPYPLFAFTGLIAWNNFSFMVSNGGNVITSNQALIRKVYFPRIILILAKVLTSFAELGSSLLLVFILQLILGHPFGWQLIFLPVFVLFNALIGCGVAIWLSAFSVKHRDLNQFVPNLVGFLIWLTPVFYPATLLPSNVSYLIYFNPVAGVVQGFRWAILGDSFPSAYYLPAFAFSILFLAIGYFFFVKTEGEITDYL
jgi:lipopolysaccharide transport system permease protein